tara:strand:- start:4695 stop:5657 length:963 start_codon:yes stop_codon:yes gene_type:complete
MNYIKLTFLFILIYSYQIVVAQNDYIQKIPKTEENIPMVFIPSGSFKMGSLKSETGHFADEEPQHQVEIDAFWIGQYEITWNLYNLFVSREIDQYQIEKDLESEVSIDVDAVSGATMPYIEMSFGMGTDGYPAIGMTQLAAIKFCEWLSAMTGKFYRLPTEAEWEYACRAGSDGAYSFGNDFNELKEYAWYADNSNEKYQKVGQKKPNSWGVYDMHGNVAEWTLDQYIATAYKKRKKDVVNPYEAATKTYPRVVRGGSWMDKPNRLRSSSRRPSSKKWKRRDPQIPKSLWWHTDAQFLGFRIIRPLETPPEEIQKKYWSY